MMRRWQRFRSLSRIDQYRLIESWMALHGVHILLLVAGFKRVYRWSDQNPSPQQMTDSDAIHQAQRMAYLVNISSRHSLLRMTCLHRALVVWRLLNRLGIPADLRLGINSHTLSLSQLEAHAWVEVDGVSLDVGQVEDSFVAFPNLPEM